jgi:Fe-S cluster assembly protein SufD
MTAARPIHDAPPKALAGLMRSPEGPDWFVRRRDDAAARFRERGLPTTHDEAWRYTSLAPVSKVAFAPASAGKVDLGWLEGAALVDEAIRVVVVDGRYAPDLCAGEVPAGVTVRALTDALLDDPSLEGDLALVAPGDHPFVALNSAAFDGGVLLRIGRDVSLERPIEIVVATGAHEGPVAIFPRILVVAEAGSRATVIETHVGVPGEASHLCAPVTEVVVGENAGLEHVRVQMANERTFHLGALGARVGRDGRYASRVVSLGADISRLDLTVRMEGEGAEAHLDGLYVGRGRQHMDHPTFVDHVRPHTTSHQLYKGVLDGEARGIFDGRIQVGREALGTVAHQQNRNLLLSDQALVNTKPSLEIDTDDVKCSHGATVGQLDDDQLFYLRARGLPIDVARAMLTQAFAGEVLGRIGHAALREKLAQTVLERLPGGEAIQELP